MKQQSGAQAHMHLWPQPVDNRQARDGEAGFTLIESMIALVVISVGLFAIGSFTISALSADALARERIMANHVASLLLEEWAQTGDVASFGITAPSAPSTASGVNSTSASYTPGQLSVQYTITVSTSRMLAPLPDGSGGVTTDMLTGTPTPIEKKVVVAWTHKGRTYSTYLTHSTLRR